jgi:glucose/arabinose dehydrogenase
VVFAPDGKLFFASSHRESQEGPQDLRSDIGKILRLNDDGTIPKDNPFVGQPDRKPEIYSYGHRTILGLTIQPRTGLLWETENGPQGGDEVNIIRPGLNYGWPVVTYGREYNGKKASETPWRKDMEEPELFWVPSITASGMTFYTGDKFPAWTGNLFVGAMTLARLPNTGHVQRIVFNENGEQRREMLLTDLKQRIRDIRLGPDGLLYLLTDENDGALVRIEPADEQPARVAQ